MSADGQYAFYAGLKYLAANLKSTLGEFGEAIYATNHDGSIVIGSKNIYDGKNFSIRAPLVVSTEILTISADDSKVYLYDKNTSRLYVQDI